MMNSYTYSLIANSDFIQRLNTATGAIDNIPPDPNNSDYQAYLAWVAAGNTIAPYVTPAITWGAYQGQAHAALNESDTTMHRISEAVALGLNSYAGADVVAFVQYRRALRAIITATTGTPGTLPTKPAYPAGT